MAGEQLVLSGKAYNKAMRAHKLTLQALWRILVPTFLLFVAESDKDFKWMSMAYFVQLIHYKNPYKSYCITDINRPRKTMHICVEVMFTSRFVDFQLDPFAF